MKSFPWISALGCGLVACGMAACGTSLSNTCADDGTCPGDGGTDVVLTDSPSTNDAPNTPDASGDGGGDEGTADTGPDTAPPGCDTAKDPKDSPPCVANSYGLFVDASKPAGGTGTKASPFKTIGAAIAATGTLKRIYVCAGTYAEKVTLDATHDGVNVYGGWSCADWTYASTNTVAVKPATGVALEIKGLSTGTFVEDISFAANDGVGAGASSVAAFVATSTGVTLRRVALTAGKGQPGGAGAPATNYTGVTAPGGSVPTGGTGGAGGVAACTLGTSSGGKGGDGVAGAAGNGGPGLSNPAATDGVRTGAGGTGGGVACNSNAIPGADAAQVPAVLGAAKLGILSATGWSPESGAKGNSGNPGQGGGGGGGKTTPVTGGGGGGAGGCGGAGGGAGGGGGASIALLSFNAFVKGEDSTLTASDAGRGGDGAIGQGGQAGGLGGDPGGGVCGGALAGNGSGGGGGSGGAGGVSAAIGYVGTAPTTSGATTLTASGATAPAGNGKAGGAGGTNALSTAPGGLGGGNGTPGSNTATKDLT